MKNKVEITAKEYDELSSEVVNIKSIDIVQQRKEKALVMKSEIEITPEESAEPSVPILLKTTESLPKDKKKTSGESFRQTVPLKSIEIVPKKIKKSLEKSAESSSQTGFTKTKEIVPKKKKKITTRKTTEQSLKNMFGKDIEIVPLNEEAIVIKSEIEIASEEGENPSSKTTHEQSVKLVGAVSLKRNYKQTKGKFRRTGSDFPDVSQITLCHFPKRIMGKSAGSRRRCRNCSSQGKLQQTRFFCETCNVGLCVAPCFEVFHANLVKEQKNVSFT